MRVLQVVQRYGPDIVGGCETHVRRVSELLAARGMDVEVFTSTATTMAAMAVPHILPSRGTLAPGVTIENGVRVTRFRGWLSTPACTPFPPSLFLGLRFRESEFDLVNGHSEHFTTVLGRMATRHRPYLWSGHLHVEMFNDAPRLTRGRLTRLMRGIDYFNPTTDFDAKFVSERFRKPVLDPVGNGIDPEDFQDGDADPPLPDSIVEGTRYVAFLGRAHLHKGYLDGAKAVAALGPGYDDVKYLHIGPRDEKAIQTYSRLPPTVRERVVCVGQVSDAQKRALLSRCSVLTLFSRYESFGIVLLEAWMLGVPVVVSDRGALPTVVGDDGIVAPHEELAAYTEGIRRYLDDPQEGRRAAARGRTKTLEKYTWRAVAERYARNYERVLSENVRN